MNTGQEENYIAKYLVKNEEIKTDNTICRGVRGLYVFNRFMYLIDLLGF